MFLKGPIEVDDLFKRRVPTAVPLLPSRTGVLRVRLRVAHGERAARTQLGGSCHRELYAVILASGIPATEPVNDVNGSRTELVDGSKRPAAR